MSLGQTYNFGRGLKKKRWTHQTNVSMYHIIIYYCLKIKISVTINKISP